jgi:hypothetical protein
MEHGRAEVPVEDLPLSAPWRAQLLHAVILAGAWVAVNGGKVRPAARMCLLREVRRRFDKPGDALPPLPPVDILQVFDSQLRQLVSPWQVRRLMARQMNPFVGTPWAITILRVAEAVAVASCGSEAPCDGAGIKLRSLRISLGLCWPTECGPPS